MTDPDTVRRAADLLRGHRESIDRLDAILLFTLAERFKHTIEPFFNVQRTSSIDNFDRIVKIESVDQVYGNTTQFTYGLNNRFYAKRKVGAASQAQEILARARTLAGWPKRTTGRMSS